MLEIKNINKKYGKTVVLKDVSLQLEKGNVISIIGKSGSGKTTLLKCLNRLEEIDEGNIFLDNKNIYDIPITILRKKIGIVFQDYNLFEHLNVLDNLVLPQIKVKKVSMNYAKESAKKYLKDFRLIDKQSKYPNELSGGEKQRIAIIRTLLMNPEIVLLDEPTSALDDDNKKEVEKFIKKLIKQGTTLLIVSHEKEFVENVSDYIYKMDKGSLEKYRG